MVEESYSLTVVETEMASGVVVDMDVFFGHDARKVVGVLAEGELAVVEEG